MDAKADPAPQASVVDAPRQAGLWNSFAAWLGEYQGQRLSFMDFAGALATRLREAGVPLARFSMSLNDYHPEVIGRSYFWEKERGLRQLDQAYTPRISDVYQASPIRQIHEGAAAIRRRLETGGDAFDFPILHELKSAGLTDYAAFPLVFSDGTRQFVSFSTDKPGGFEAPELALMESVLPLLAARVEIEHAHAITLQLLRTYLGEDAAARVISGGFRRIMGEEIDAIVFACDMRGFTGLTDALPAAAIIGLLSAYYDAVAAPVREEGGDIVKMIADGILAIFPIAREAKLDACCTMAERAVRAVKKAAANLEALTPEALPEGAWPLKAGFALHFGKVTFGNVGSRDRLDFTVIGPAVNEAFRLEALTKQLQRTILVSAPFAALILESEVEPLGPHALKGVREAKEVFALRL